MFQEFAVCNHTVEYGALDEEVILPVALVLARAAGRIRNRELQLRHALHQGVHERSLACARWRGDHEELSASHTHGRKQLIRHARIIPRSGFVRASARLPLSYPPQPWSSRHPGTWKTTYWPRGSALASRNRGVAPPVPLKQELNREANTLSS